MFKKILSLFFMAVILGLVIWLLWQAAAFIFTQTKTAWQKWLPQPKLSFLPSFVKLKQSLFHKNYIHPVIPFLI
jgi:hypothetical protein